MESHSKATAAIATLVIGLLVGGAAGWAIADMSGDNANNNGSMSQEHKKEHAVEAVDSKAADLRATLVSFGTEHMDLTYTAVSSALQGDKSAEADKAALIQNGHDIGAAVGSVYGEDAEKTFNTVWDIHLVQFVNYAVAASTGDQAGKEKALATIDSDYSKPLAAHLAKANPNLPEDVLYSSLKEHVSMTADMIDAQAAGNYQEAQEHRDMSVKHLEGLFSTLAGGIVKQFPEKF